MAKNNRKKSELAEELLQTPQDPNGSATTLNGPDLTPEQRRILGKAYRMILNWPDDGIAPTGSTPPDQAASKSLAVSNHISPVTVGD